MWPFRKLSGRRGLLADGMSKTPRHLKIELRSGCPQELSPPKCRVDELEEGLGTALIGFGHQSPNEFLTARFAFEQELLSRLQREGVAEEVAGEGGDPWVQRGVSFMMDECPQ